MKKVIMVALSCVTILSTAALAQPQGFGPARGGPVAGFNGPNAAKTSIAQIMQTGYDDQIVVLNGRLTQYYGDNWYVFQDEKGDKIDVELDDDRGWYNIKKDQLITIVAEIDRDYQRVTLNVKDAQPVAK